MKQFKLMAVTALLLGAGSAQALTPWTNGAPNLTIRVSGAVAQNKAYTQVVTDVLAASDTLDTFNDVDEVTGSVGSNWTAHYFIGKDSLGAGLAGKKILLLRRTRGGTGYGVIPLKAGIPLEHLNIVGLPQSAWLADGGKAWKQVISAANADKYLVKKQSDAGAIANDPAILLKPGTENYPDQQNELTTGLPEPGWPDDVTSIPTSGDNAFTLIPTSGLAYGVAVTLDLYKVLQAAQRRAGILQDKVVIGDYSEAAMPTLHRNVIGSLLAGKIGAWDQFKIVDKSDGNTVKSLTDSDILTDAGVTAPYKESITGTDLTPVALGLRNNGAATGVIAYSVFLNYPAVRNAVRPAPKTADDPVEEDASLPIVKQPVIVSDTGALLKDWQNGTNVLGFNNVIDGAGFAKRWGIAINPADKNTSVTATGVGGDPWRYLRIDGYAPTLENIAAGVYSYWAEGVVLYRTKKPGDTNWELKTKLIKTLAENLGSPAILNLANSTQAWGKTGAVATTVDPRGFTAGVPFSVSNPVSPFSHKNYGGVHTEIVPVADAAAQGGLQIQLK